VVRNREERKVDETGPVQVVIQACNCVCVCDVEHQKRVRKKGEEIEGNYTSKRTKAIVNNDRSITRKKKKRESEEENERKGG